MGRIKSIQYFNHTNNKIYPRDKILKRILNEKGYCRVDLSKSGKIKRHRVHRLVAETFIPNPYNLLEVNHIDGNKQNNNVNNLEWCSHSYNMKEACKLVGMSYKTLYGWVSNNEISYTKIGNRYYLTSEQLNSLVFVYSKDLTQATK